MPVISVPLTEEEWAFLDEVAKSTGTSISELLKTTTMEVLEDSYDATVGDLAYEAYLRNPVSRPLAELMKEHGLAVDDE